MERIYRDERGSVIVLAALMMVVFLGFLALVIDVGNLYLEKSRLQKAVDAAVLAGVQELPVWPDDAVHAAQYAAAQNGLNGENAEILVGEKDRSVQAVGSRTVELFFANSLGFPNPTLRASATASIQPLTAGEGAVPLGVDESRQLIYGDVVKLKVGDSTVGNFGALALTGPGAKDYKTDLQNGYGFELEIGTVLDTQTGNLAGPTRDAVSYRISGCSGTFDHHPSVCSRVVLIPVYKPVAIQSNQVKQVQIVGFATFFLESVTSTNEGAEVVGRFIQKAITGSISANQTDYGTYGYKLTQ
ncbi:Tad domain-containing protein [Pseudalkalibacillus caeni]|nr:Tad domain-containing protein [Pseudalkalibacillus caeni]